MRSLNLFLLLIIGACALLLILIALPTFGHRPLAHWAMNVGIWVSALVISLLYLGAWLIAPAKHQKSQVVIISTYLPALLIGLLTGAMWGAVGHVMQTEDLDFTSAFDGAGSLIYIGYLLVFIITISTALYLTRVRKRHVAQLN